MRFDRLYRASLYVTLFLGTLLLCIDSTSDNRYAMAYPTGVGVASILAFLTVDRDPKRGLPRDLANFLALLSFGLGLIEYYNNTDLIMQPIGHTLVYLQVIKYLLPKTVEDDWYLFLLGLVQVVIGVYISPSDEVGILLFLWALASIWTFGLFYLRRESLRESPPPGVTVTPAFNRAEPYPGLLNLGFFLATARAVGTTLALGALIFLLMPRWSARARERPGQAPSGAHLTGFSESVKLGNMGEILENDSVVMSIELTDEREQSITPDPEMLLRGITLTEYANGQWDREQVDRSSTQNLIPNDDVDRSQIRQRIRMEATDSDVLFALRPMLRVWNASADVRLNALDGTIFRGEPRGDRRTAKFDYTVYSAADPSVPQFGERPRRGRSIEPLLAIDGPLEERLKVIVAPILEKLPPEARDSPEAKVRALESHLRDGEFTYSLRMTKTDPSIDPVLDFLLNRKEGHCEYFASALALMCRVAGVPSRMVNGFKGGDWNDLSRVTLVREKHAHSWVEALVSYPDTGRPRWLTLDPTPGRQRDEVVAKVGSGSVRYRYWSDFLRAQWTFYVVGFDPDRQERKIYGPIRQLAEDAMRGFRVLYGMLGGLRSWFYFEDVRTFFSVRGFIVSVLAMLLLVALSYPARWLARRMFGRHRAGAGDAEGRDPSVAFYHRLVRILVPYGLERPPGETPREFARRAADLVAGKRPDLALAAVPALVVDAFYARRFGRDELSPETIRELEARLEELETGLAAEPGR